MMKKHDLSMKGRMHLASESAHEEVERYKKNKKKSRRKKSYKR